MKSFLKIFLLVFLLVTLLASTAAALSDKDYKLLLKDPAFAKADKELNKTWKETRKILAGDKDALERVRKAHMEWVKTGRDEEAKLWREQEGLSWAESYTRATIEQTKALENWTYQEAAGHK